MSSISSPASGQSAGAPIVALQIAGMSCGHCVAAVRSALDEVPGVRIEQVAVGSARLAIDPAAGSASDVTRAAIDAIRDAGYDAHLA